MFVGSEFRQHVAFSSKSEPAMRYNLCFIPVVVSLKTYASFSSGSLLHCKVHLLANLCMGGNGDKKS